MKEIDAVLPFSKMHGAANDYVYFDWRAGLPADLNLLSRQVSDRRFGLGSDGIVVILPSSVADFRMRMFNADGSEAQMCGNASRCVAKYLYEHHLTDKTELMLETLAGIKHLSFKPLDGKVHEVTVDMGRAVDNASEIPVIASDSISVTAEILDKKIEITAVGMGNPHGVVFVDKITDRHVLQLGPLLEHAPIWPEGANIEFAEVVSPSELRMRVWERGTGETYACGTGACAVAVAAFRKGIAGPDVCVRMRGGTLHIRIDKRRHVMMTGPAVEVARGELNTEALKCNPEI